MSDLATFEIGQRVTINYGPGTVVSLVPDASGMDRPPIVVVEADAGGVWFRAPEDVEALDAA